MKWTFLTAFICLFGTCFSQKFVFKETFGKNATTRSASPYMPANSYLFADPTIALTTGNATLDAIYANGNISGDYNKQAYINSIDNNTYAIVSPNYIANSVPAEFITKDWSGNITNSLYRWFGGWWAGQSFNTQGYGNSSYPTTSNSNDLNDADGDPSGGVMVVNGGTFYSEIYARDFVIEPDKTYEVSFKHYVSQPTMDIGLALWVPGAVRSYTKEANRYEPVSTTGQIASFHTGVIDASSTAWALNKERFIFKSADCMSGTATARRVTLVVRNIIAAAYGNDYYIDNITVEEVDNTTPATVTLDCNTITTAPVATELSVSGQLFFNKNGEMANSGGTSVDAARAAKYVSLVDENGIVIAIADIKPDGTYSFTGLYQGVLNGTYRLVLHYNMATSSQINGLDRLNPDLKIINNWEHTGNSGDGTPGVVYLTANSLANASIVANFAVYSASALPVNFGSLAATITNGVLSVDWSTLKETNNSYFEVEASKDGKTFVSLGKVASKARDGNSDVAISYDFTKGLDSTTGLLGISLFSIALVALLLNRKNKSLYALVLMFGLSIFGVSCKKQDVGGINTTDSLMVRIKQVDKDGSVKYSSVVKATVK